MLPNNYDQIMYGSCDKVDDGEMDRRRDGKSDTQRWVPNLKKHYFRMKSKRTKIYWTKP